MGQVCCIDRKKSYKVDIMDNSDYSYKPYEFTIYSKDDYDILFESVTV